MLDLTPEQIVRLSDLIGARFSEGEISRTIFRATGEQLYVDLISEKGTQRDRAYALVMQLIKIGTLQRFFAALFFTYRDRPGLETAWAQIDPQFQNRFPAEIKAEHFPVEIKNTGPGPAIPPSAGTEAPRQASVRGLIISATTIAALLGGYFVALATLLKSWAALAEFRATLGDLWFSALFALPIIAVLPSSVLLVQRQLREKRLSKTILTELPAKPGLFRLQPYEARDAADFYRADGADAKVRDWLRAAPGSLLWLSGASGTGKSSLISASLLPKLEAEGWRCISLRVDRNPSDRLTEGPALSFRAVRRFATGRDRLIRAAAHGGS